MSAATATATPTRTTITTTATRRPPSHTPASRSSRPLLDGAEAPAGDLVAEEAAAAVAAYAPTDAQLRDAIFDADGDDSIVAAAAIEEGGEGEEDEGELMRQRFWWQQQQQVRGEGGGAGAALIGEELLPPLRIPDKDGVVREAAAQSLLPTPSPPVRPRMAGRGSFLAQQDRLYLGPVTPPAVRAPSPASLASRQPSSPSPGSGGDPRRQCVLVVFAANDLRAHDSYTLALASMRAHAAGGIPVVAVCVLDYRTFAQPSLVGGFYRQGPQRAAYLLDTVAALRDRLEAAPLHVPLLVRVGRPEEHVPRLAVELGAVDVFATTQYAPHERRVHSRILDAVRRGAWVSREELDDDDNDNDAEGEGELMVRVVEHVAVAASAKDGEPVAHPYGGTFAAAAAAVPHSVWQSTLVHLDDLPTPVAAMREGERWFHDDVTTATIRPTAPYDAHIERLGALPCWSELLPTAEERAAAREAGGGVALRPPPASPLRGALPSLVDLGYAAGDDAAAAARLLQPADLIATESSHPGAGEAAAFEHVARWLEGGGMTSMLRYGRPRRTNTKMYSGKLARVSPFLSTGALSPRRFYEAVRAFANDNLRDGFVQMQYREALLRLSRRDYWHFIGLRYGDRLFYSYGPHPDTTDGLPDWRHDAKITQKWCAGLTGIPFADAAMRELTATGFVGAPGRQALVWLLARGYGQDWRLAAEWLERCSLDYDPFTCYGNAAYVSQLIRDDFGETVRSVHFLAHQHDQTGIYVKRWLPQLSKVPPVYIHRPHVLTPRMQAMHGVFLGKNYPYPLKLWDGAQRDLSAAQLPSYYAGDGLTALDAAGTSGGGAAAVEADRNYRAGAAVGPGYAEALRCGAALLQPEELSTAVEAADVVRRPWARSFLPAETLAAIGGSAFDGWPAEEEEGDEVRVRVRAEQRQRAAQEKKKTRQAVE